MTKLFRAGLLALLLVFVEQAGAGDYILPCTGTQGPLATPAPSRVNGLPAQVRTLPAQTRMAVCGSYIVGYASTGVVGGYWCQAAPDKQPYPVFGAARWNVFTAEMLADLASIPLASDPGEAARLFQAKHVTTNFYNMCDVWGHPSTDWRQRFNAAMPIVQAPSPAVWKTVLTGNRMWNAAGGKLVSQVSPARFATPDTPCDCAVTKLSIGTVTYCALPAAPASEVTSCRLVP